jgi:hypothetical protein
MREKIYIYEYRRSLETAGREVTGTGNLSWT